MTKDTTDQFTQLLEEYEQVRPRRGQIVQGEVISLDEDMFLLDVGAKRDAVVPNRELARFDDELFEDISIGDIIPVYITDTSSFDDELLVSVEKGLEQQDWDRAKEYFESKELLDLKIIGYNKGGLRVNFGRLDGFVPNSMIPALPRGLNNVQRQSRKADMIGDEIRAKIIEVDQQRKRLIISGKAAAKEDRQKRLQELQVGEKVTGIVSNVVDFGVFVDLGGVDGLIHVSKLSWEKIDHPSDVLQPGDEVEVLVKDIDIERERISLDRKGLLPGPWNDFAQEHVQGDILKGEVVSLRDFGAFVRLTDKITGLLHVSEFLLGVSREPKKVFNVGDEILVRIMDIDKEQHRVSLSMRRLPEDAIANWMIEE